MAAPVYKYDRILGAGRETDGSPLGTADNPFSPGAYFLDSNGTLWLLSIDTTGHVVTAQTESDAGTIFGLWSFLPRTYSE